ncbi:MAG: NifU family protein [Acidimicrobiales bacterium]
MGEAAVQQVLSEDERGRRLAAVDALIEVMRPAVKIDGGDLVLVSADVETGVIEVMLQGACSSCAISGTTLEAGVERIMKDRLNWVTQVRGGVDSSVPYETSVTQGKGNYVPRSTLETPRATPEAPRPTPLAKPTRRTRP